VVVDFFCPCVVVCLVGFSCFFHLCHAIKKTKIEGVHTMGSNCCT
jgi:hypothetical protein